MTMTISSATFATNEVALYLDRKYPYAATCFSQDMAEYGDTVASAIVEKWFKRYFPSNVNQFEFRSLEAAVTQTVQIN